MAPDSPEHIISTAEIDLMLRGAVPHDQRAATTRRRLSDPVTRGLSFVATVVLVYDAWGLIAVFRRR